MTHPPFYSTATAVVLVLAVGPAFTSASEVVVVCPAAFRQTLQPWIEHRQDDGLAVTVISSHHDGSRLRQLVREASDSKTQYVVLIGDTPTIGTACDSARQVPMLYAPTSVTAKFGSTPTLSSDMGYGDYDNDGAPEAVVGRLPVDTRAQLSSLIQRIIAYEQSDDFGPWRSQVQLVGGVGGFGAIADAAIESVTRTIVTSVLPIETQTSILYASPGHHFWPAGDSFTDAVVDRYCCGSRFWVYAGHGQVTELDRVPPTRQGVPVLDRRSVQQLNRPAESAPIALILACFTGACDASEDSFAEEMLLSSGGPVAVIAGSRVTMPYGNTTAAMGLIQGVYEQQLPRLGDSWLSTLHKMHTESDPNRSTARTMVDALATIINPAGTKLPDERREHMLLYNLFGDPTLRMSHPQPIELEAASGYEAGVPMELTVNSPIDGQLTLSLDRPLGATVQGDPNKTSVAQLSFAVSAGQIYHPKIKLPKAHDAYPLVIRAFVTGKKSWATGSAQTMMRAADADNRVTETEAIESAATR